MKKIMNRSEFLSYDWCWSKEHSSSHGRHKWHNRNVVLEVNYCTTCIQCIMQHFHCKVEKGEKSEGLGGKKGVCDDSRDKERLSEERDSKQQ